MRTIKIALAAGVLGGQVFSAIPACAKPLTPADMFVPGNWDKWEALKTLDKNASIVNFLQSDNSGTAPTRFNVEGLVVCLDSYAKQPAYKQFEMGDLIRSCENPESLAPAALYSCAKDNIPSLTEDDTKMAYKLAMAVQAGGLHKNPDAPPQTTQAILLDMESHITEIGKTETEQATAHTILEMMRSCDANFTKEANKEKETGSAENSGSN